VECNMAPVYYLFNVLLIALQILNTIWFYYILMAAWVFVTKGQVEKDERSETEPDSESEDERDIIGKPQNGEAHRNGVLTADKSVLKRKIENGGSHLVNNNTK